jgi:hypothetical protein
MTPFRRWHFRRDLLIWCAARRLGFSQRVLADIFDTPHSNIARVVAKFDDPERRRPPGPPGGELGRVGEDGSAAVETRSVGRGRRKSGRRPD